MSVPLFLITLPPRRRQIQGKQNLSPLSVGNKGNLHRFRVPDPEGICFGTFSGSAFKPRRGLNSASQPSVRAKSFSGIYPEIPIEIRKSAVNRQKATRELKSGDPKDEDIFIGPMISEDEAERVMEWIEEAKEAGAEVLCGGDSGEVIT